MKKLAILFSLAVFILAFAEIKAQTDNPNPPKTHGNRFVDNNGDGYNDNAPDHDGDGIPNGVDPDYTGPKNRKGSKGFVDADGDGINDNAKTLNNQNRHRNSYGKGSKGFGLKDGSGNNQGGKGTGNQGGQR